MSIWCFLYAKIYIISSFGTAVKHGFRQSGIATTVSVYQRPVSGCKGAEGEMVPSCKTNENMRAKLQRKLRFAFFRALFFLIEACSIHLSWGHSENTLANWDVSFLCFIS